MLEATVFTLDSNPFHREK